MIKSTDPQKYLVNKLNYILENKDLRERKQRVSEVMSAFPKLTISNALKAKLVKAGLL